MGGMEWLGVWNCDFSGSEQPEDLEKIALSQKRPFVHNSVCSHFLEGLFAILAECSQFCLRSF